MTTYGRSARLLRRYGPWTLVVTTATVAAAYALNQQAPSGFESEATILVEARVSTAPTAPALSFPVSPDADTERSVILSDAVLLPAAGRVGSPIGEYARDLTVEVVPDTSVLRVTYTSENRFSAQIRTRALVDAYVDYRAQGPTDVTVLSAPTLPTDPGTRPLVPDLAAGLAAGLLLGAGTAFLRSRTRGKIRSRDDFAALARTPVLATVPRHKGAGTPVVLREPESPAAESYRYLRSRLAPALRPTSTTTILVTSPGDRQGRTGTAANLAVTLAQSGRSVVLIDADLRNPRLHLMFQVPGDHGLTTLLDGDTGVSEVVEETSVPRLSLIPAGRRDGDHVDLMDSTQIARVLRAVQKHADIVVVDTSAVLSSADPIALAPLSDLVLLVGDYTRTSRESVRRALAELTEVVHGNINPVLVNVPKSAGALVPRPRVHSATLVNEPLTRDRLVSDADDVAPPGVTSHTYVDVDDTGSRSEIADFYARTTTVAVPVIYGSTQTATVYASSNAAATASPSPSPADPPSSSSTSSSSTPASPSPSSSPTSSSPSSSSSSSDAPFAESPDSVFTDVSSVDGAPETDLDSLDDQVATIAPVSPVDAAAPSTLSSTHDEVEAGKDTAQTRS